MTARTRTTRGLQGDARSRIGRRVGAVHQPAESASGGSTPPQGGILADTLLVDHTVEPYEYAATAAQWCGVDLAALEAGLDPDVAGAAEAFDGIAGFWMTQEAGRGGIRARRAAVALAEDEHLIAHPMWWPRVGRDRRAASWPERARRHVRRLAAVAGYELTDYDREHLGYDPVGDDGSSAARGASAGSTPDPEGSPA